MVMRFMGGGVGHKATNAFTQVFACEAQNLPVLADPQAVDDDSLEDGNQDKDLEGAGDAEEEDYGYVVSDSEDLEEEGAEDEEEGEDLGGEDGEEPWEMDDIQAEGFDDL
jgi:hypothetical protein